MLARALEVMDGRLRKSRYNEVIFGYKKVEMKRSMPNERCLPRNDLHRLCGRK